MEEIRGTAFAKRRYEIGLEKLETTEKSVQVMQKELEALQPELVKTTKQVDEMMIVVERETADAEKIRVVVVAEEEKVNEKVLEAKTIKGGCDETWRGRADPCGSTQGAQHTEQKRHHRS